MENIDEKKLYEIQFVQLIFSLKTSAIIQLGKITNPLTGSIDRDLNEAKYTIDMLNMIKEKTKNNLTHDEEKMVNDAVFELQMNYIDEVKKGEEPEEKEPKEESADKQELKEEVDESKEHAEKEEEKEKPMKKVKENLDKKRKNPKAEKKNENKA